MATKLFSEYISPLFWADHSLSLLLPQYDIKFNDVFLSAHLSPFVTLNHISATFQDNSMNNYLKNFINLHILIEILRRRKKLEIDEI